MRVPKKVGRRAAGHEIGSLDRIHGGMPEAEDQETDDLGCHGIEQKRGDGLIDQADGFEITGDECPESTSDHSQQYHQRQQCPAGQLLEGERAPGGKGGADIELTFAANIDQAHAGG